DLHTRRVDVMLTPLVVTSERMKILEYLPVTHALAYHFITSPQKIRLAGVGGILSIFRPSIWMVLASTSVLLILLLSKNLMLVESVTTVATSLLQQVIPKRRSVPQVATMFLFILSFYLGHVLRNSLLSVCTTQNLEPSDSIGD